MNTAFLNAEWDRRLEKIRNTKDEISVSGSVFYVSAEGNDAFDGTSPERAWRTLSRVSEATLKAGDGVCFRRGDVFRGALKTAPGVTYFAYGEGEKPRFYGWDESLADGDLWECYDADLHIWKYKKPILDVGTLVFDNGAAHSYKLIPSYIDGRFVCREDENRPFDMRREMIRDLDLFWYYEGSFVTTPSKGEDFPIPQMGPSSFGTLYLRCDRGNPGEICSSLEALPRRNMIVVGENENVRVDNLCLKYIGAHAIGAGGACVRGLRVTNCEIGWIGGVIQHYFGTDPNYPEGRRGTVTRYGNGVEIYGGCDGYEVSNCYFYQIYDAAMTHQVTTWGKKLELKNVLYRDNLVENCVYSIEYFLDMIEGDTESYMENIEMCDNFLRLAGYGWGQQRHNKHTPAHIKGWSYYNAVKAGYSIHHNIFDRSAYRLVHLVAEKQSYCPQMHDNVYVQYENGVLGQYGGKEAGEPPILDCNAQTVSEVLHDADARVYIVK